MKRGGGQLTRWAPLEKLERLQEQMERSWGQALPCTIARLPRRLAPAQGARAPRIDVFDKDANLVVTAELPGIKKEDIEVAPEQGDLVIHWG